MDYAYLIWAAVDDGKDRAKHPSSCKTPLRRKKSSEKRKKSEVEEFWRQENKQRAVTEKCSNLSTIFFGLICLAHLTRRQEPKHVWCGTIDVFYMQRLDAFCTNRSCQPIHIFRDSSFDDNVFAHNILNQKLKKISNLFKINFLFSNFPCVRKFGTWHSGR